MCHYVAYVKYIISGIYAYDRAVVKGPNGKLRSQVEHSSWNLDILGLIINVVCTFYYQSKEFCFSSEHTHGLQLTNSPE